MIHEKLLTTLEVARLLECPGESPEEQAQCLMVELFQMGFVKPSGPDWSPETDGLPEIPTNLFWKPGFIERVKKERGKVLTGSPATPPGESTGTAQGKRPPLSDYDRLLLHGFVESHIGFLMRYLDGKDIDPVEAESILEVLRP